MKSLIALVVAVGLIIVQGTSIIRHVTSIDLGYTNDHDQNNVDDRDSKLAKRILNKIYNKEWSEYGFFASAIGSSFGCTESTCKFCKAIFCIKVTYDAPFNSFSIRGTILDKEIYCKTFQVKPWSDCGSINMPFGNVNSCVTINKIKIQGGRVCLDVKANAGGNVLEPFLDVCL